MRCAYQVLSYLAGAHWLDCLDFDEALGLKGCKQVEASYNVTGPWEIVYID